MNQDDFFTQLGIEPRETRRTTGRRLDAERARRREERARRRRKRKRRLITALILVVVLAAVGGIGYKAYNYSGLSSIGASPSDYSGAGEGEVIVTIPDGATGNDIAKVLVDADVVATAGAFANAYADNANASNIQPGTYTLRSHMSAANAVAMLLDPASRSDHTLTIPEGATKTQVKDRLMSVGHYTDTEVEEAFGATDAIGLPAVAGGNVEGWLAPGVYDVADGSSATDIVTSMVSTTRGNLAKLGVNDADYESVLTKASIVEREGNPQYYTQIARVIENRLTNTDAQTQGKLEMDSTVLYGLNRTGGIPSKEEIADGSNKYNTYAHPGLPPSPIGSPGSAAISAVMKPAEGDWLYFVTVNLQTGETLFATTQAEQDENTKKLTEYCNQNPGVCDGGNGSGATGSATPSAGAGDGQ